MSLRYILTTLTVLAWVLVSAPGATAQSADVVISNGKILTVDPEFSIAHSLAITDGRIVAIGSAEAVAGHRGPNTRVIELGGKTVIPGLIDNHFHSELAVRGFHSFKIR